MTLGLTLPVFPMPGVGSLKGHFIRVPGSVTVMPQMTLQSFKKTFIDRQKVYTAFDRAALKTLGRIGALSMTVGRRSQRKARPKKMWAPKPLGVDGDLKMEMLKWAGHLTDRELREAVSPWPLTTSVPNAGTLRINGPNVRHGLIKKMTLFGVDMMNYSLLIGPALAGGGNWELLKALEFGGSVETDIGEWKGFYDKGKVVIRLVKSKRRRIFLMPRRWISRSTDFALDTLMPGIWQDALNKQGVI